MEAESDFVGGKLGQEAVVIAFAAAEAVVMAVEGDAGNEGEVDAAVVGKELADGLADAVGAGAEVVRTGVVAEFEGVVGEYGGEYEVFFTAPVFDEGVGAHFVGEGVVEQQGAGGTETGVLLELLQESVGELVEGFGTVFFLFLGDVAAELLLVGHRVCLLVIFPVVFVFLSGLRGGVSGCKCRKNVGISCGPGVRGCGILPFCVDFLHSGRGCVCG